MKTLQNYKDGFSIPTQGFIYDPKIKGYDNSFFADVVGTPALVSDKINLNEAAMASFIQATIGELAFSIDLPSVPASGDARYFGYYMPTNEAGIGFNFVNTGEVIAAISLPNVGAVYTKSLDTALFTEGEHVLTVDWNEGSVAFYVGDVCVAVCEDKSILRQLKALTFPIYVSNENEDNLTVSLISLTDCGRIN